MSIRSIVTMGYSNGTFSIGTDFLPTLGYSLAILTEGPGKFVMGEVYKPGFMEGEVYKPEFKMGDAYLPGFQQGQVDK